MLIDFVDEEIFEMKILSEMEVLMDLSRDRCFSKLFLSVFAA